MSKRKQIKELEQRVKELTSKGLADEATMKWQANRIAAQQRQIADRDDMLDKVRGAVGHTTKAIIYGGGGGGGQVIFK